MEKKTKPRKTLYIGLSIIIACCLWLYVRNVDNPDAKVPLNNISITLVGEDILNSANLMVANGTSETVSLQVQGKWGTVAKVRRDNVTIRVDVSKISTPGTYNLAYDIVWPNTVSTSDLLVLERNPFYVPITVVKRVTRTIDVKGSFAGSVEDGYQADEFVFQPAQVEISGQESEVNQVSHALVTLNQDKLDTTVKEDMAYSLVGVAGQPLSGLEVTRNPERINVTLPVVMVKEVPIAIDFKPGGGATEENITYSISPQSVMLSGDKEQLSAYDEINLGSIDLARVISSESVTFPIPIGEGMNNISGVTEATVTVKVNGLDTKTLETDNIDIINIPDGINATPVTQSVQVQVRGPSDVLDLVLPQYIRVVVDLKDLSLPAGQNMVPAKIYLDGVTEAGALGEYKISITLSGGIQ